MIALGPDEATLEASNLVLAISFALLCAPFAFLAVFSSRKVPGSRIGFPVLVVIGFLIASAIMVMALGIWLDIRELSAFDADRMLARVAAVFELPKAASIVYFGGAASMIFLGVMLRPIAAIDSTVKPFRTLLILSGIAQASIIGLPIALALFPLSYGALGAFLIMTRIGIEPKPSLRFVDDYYPS